MASLWYVFCRSDWSRLESNHAVESDRTCLDVFVCDLRARCWCPRLSCLFFFSVFKEHHDIRCAERMIVFLAVIDFLKNDHLTWTAHTQSFNLFVWSYMLYFFHRVVSVHLTLSSFGQHIFVESNALVFD